MISSEVSKAGDGRSHKERTPQNPSSCRVFKFDHITILSITTSKLKGGSMCQLKAVTVDEHVASEYSTTVPKAQSVEQ